MKMGSDLSYVSKISRILVVLGGLVGITQGCTSNTQCSYTYTGTDKCFMEATYSIDSSTSEGFCWGGSFLSSGDCQKKKSLGENCINSGGNADNNNCVTRYCSSASSTCEVRESGCASLTNCIAVGFDFVAASLTLDSLTGMGSDASVTTSNENCDDPENYCSGDISVDASGAAISVTFDDAQAGPLTSSGTMGASFKSAFNFHVDMTDFEVDFDLGTLVFALDGDYALDFGELEGDFSNNYMLSDGSSICHDPAGESCEPYMVFQKMVKIGVLAIQIEIGIQMVAQISGSVTGSYVHTISCSNSISIPMSGTVDSSGITFNSPSLDSWDITDFIEGTSGSVLSDAVMQISPQVFISVNGVEVYGGLETKFYFAGDFEFSGDGCISGSAAVGVGLNIGFYVPPIEVVATVIEQACSNMVQGVFGTVTESEAESSITSDQYGTECVILETTCSETTGLEKLCGTMASVLGGMVETVAGQVIQTDGFTNCASLYSYETTASTSSGGDSCSVTSSSIDFSCFYSEDLVVVSNPCAGDSISIGCSFAPSLLTVTFFVGFYWLLA